MNTLHNHPGGRGRPISLNSSETVRLEKPHSGEEIEITVKMGVIRIAANQSKNAEDITLASVKTIDQIKWRRKSLKYYNLFLKFYNSAVNSSPRYK